MQIYIYIYIYIMNNVTRKVFCYYYIFIISLLIFLRQDCMVLWHNAITYVLIKRVLCGLHMLGHHQCGLGNAVGHWFCI